MRVCQNASPSPGYPVQKLIRKSTDRNVNWKVSVVRSTDPTITNDDAAVSDGNGLSVSESEVSEVSGMLGVARKERVFWLQMPRKKRHKYPFLVPKKSGKIQPPDFNLHLFYTQSESSNTLEN